MRALRSSGLVLAAALLAAPIVAHGAPQPRSTPSGLPVPRYVTLKLPVQVVAETDEWRRICDPDGGLSWVHKRTTDGRRAAMRVAPGPAAIRAHPNIGAGVQAYLAPRALAELDRCEKGWCKVKVGRISGWAAASDLWGAADAAQCR